MNYQIPLKARKIISQYFEDWKILYKNKLLKKVY